ncbi:helix-turn-helix domain-containing protein [Phenylobacterium sp.]|uniref:helix-turn-helix domain-containing protein n=1 Tax=Phenylobacterium sp. TaxID=1871053 RepID=UPI00286B427E|nr:helix-turn-helix domain-containing protein [Phenylobacterium sp.]
MVGEAWRGELIVGDRWARWRGGVGDNAAHRHLAAQAVLAESDIEIEDGQGRVFRGRRILIDPLVEHRLGAAPHADVLLIESTRLGQDARAEIAALDLELSSVVLLEAARPSMRFWRWLLTGGVAPLAAPGEAITRSLRRIDQDLAVGPVRIQGAADAAGLSTERYRHVFVADMGLPFRRYVLWRRLMRAFTAMAAGEAATSAAHTAGFADSAHMARTVRAMLGVTARQIVS